MIHRALLATACTVTLLSLTGCPSRGGTPEAGAPGAGQTTSTPASSGPLAGLDPNTAKSTTWQMDSGPAPFLEWEAQHLRLSAGCRQSNGQLDCDAIRFVRGGPAVELTPQERGKMLPPGALICKKMGNQNVTGRDPRGNEDGFCVFRDGSMVSNGSLEFYTLKQ